MDSDISMRRAKSSCLREPKRRFTRPIPSATRPILGRPRSGRNRQPERWRDKREVDHVGTLEHRISLMTPEERLARLRELQAKARLAIEGEAEEVEE
jgi:hypothetical protein